METVKAVLDQSAVLSKEFGPIAYPDDIKDNFHDARCVGNGGEYTTCEFKLKLTGGGGQRPTKTSNPRVAQTRTMVSILFINTRQATYSSQCSSHNVHLTIAFDAINIAIAALLQSTQTLSWYACASFAILGSSFAVGSRTNSRASSGLPT